jgi:tripartite-type tricarboxylate transporter receptor subunit TctC
MLTTHSVVSIFSVAMMVLGAGLASGQTYPNKPIRVVTSDAGGISDFTARLLVPGISGALGQPVVVDNRRSGLLGEIASKAPPDGYTLLLHGNALWIGPLMQKMPYDPVRDFAPVTLTTNTVSILAVPSSLPVKSVKELIALAKARPGELNYGASGTGGNPHLSAELFKSMAGVNIVRIQYKGGATAITALIRDEVQLMITAASGVVPHIKSGRLNALAVSSAQPSALFPALPTIAASGLPGYASEVLGGVFAPAKTSTAIIKRLNQEIVRILNQPDVKQKFLDSGTEVVGSSPEQMAALIKSDMATMGKVIKDAGITTDD